MERELKSGFGHHQILSDRHISGSGLAQHPKLSVEIENCNLRVEHRWEKGSYGKKCHRDARRNLVAG